MMADDVRDESTPSEPLPGTATGNEKGTAEEHIRSVAGRLESKYTELEQRLVALAADWTQKAESITRDAERRIADLSNKLESMAAALKARSTRSTAKKSTPKPAAKSAGKSAAKSAKMAKAAKAPKGGKAAKSARPGKSPKVVSKGKTSKGGKRR